MGTIPYGADIHTVLQNYCDANGISNAWVNLLGALSEAKLAWYGQETHEYYERVFTGEYEITNATGNISLKDGKAFGHIHMTLSDTDFKCWGGHLMPGSTKVFACEFILIALDSSTPFCRDTKDPETGLNLWCKIN